MSLLTQRFRAAQARADHWGLAAKACVESLGGLRPTDTLGFVYVTPAFVDDLASIVTFLRETTRIEHWIGGVGHGVIGPEGEMYGGGALAVMVAGLDPDTFRVFDDADDVADTLDDWIDAHIPVFGLVHGDARDATIADRVAALGDFIGGPLTGGLTAARGLPTRVADRVTPAPLSGALFGGGVQIRIGLTQGCVPIGPVHTVSDSVEGIVLSLDDRTALDVLKDDAGEILARDMRRAAGFIHAALPVDGPGAYAVRNLTGIDPQRGWLAVGAPLEPGDQMLFVRRDANAAQDDMRQMLAQLASQVGPIRGGIYVACVGRGPHMFGAESRETEILFEELGAFPLVGFYADGEICRDRLYSYTGVLTLFV